MDNILKQFLFDLSQITYELQKKPPDNNTHTVVEKGSGPKSLNE